MHRAVDATDLSIIWPSPSITTSIQIREELAKSSKKSSSGQLSTSQNGKSNENGTSEGKEIIKKYFDPQIANNEAQKRAVEAVVFRQNKHVPFLLFGSFGTGKTKTLVHPFSFSFSFLTNISLFIIKKVEMVKQVLANTKTPRILICAKVNSAADLFIEKLSSILTSAEMFRLFAFHRRIE
jgi:hypothetical protein